MHVKYRIVTFLSVTTQLADKSHNLGHCFSAPTTPLLLFNFEQRASAKLDEFFKDKKPHLYTLVLRPDNTFQISIDHNVSSNICTHVQNL